MEKQDLISVIVPVYNVERYISYCLDSIIHQKYSNLEIILIDDGSTDNSGKICDYYSKMDNRIKVIHKKNGGLADARNVGIQNASGDYIGFVDSDDYIHPEFYDVLLHLIKQHHTEISECDFLRIQVEDIDRARNLLDSYNLKINDNITVKNNVECLNELFGTHLKSYIKKVVVCNKLYKKGLWDNIQFPVGRLHEDEFTTYKVIYSSQQMVSTNRSLYGYMQTKNSIMRNIITQKRIQDTMDAYDEVTKFFHYHSNQELQYKASRKYLENCIELSAKVFQEQSIDKEDKLAFIYRVYNQYYHDHIEEISILSQDKKESQIIELLKKAKNNNTLNYIQPIYWDELNAIVSQD